MAKKSIDLAPFGAGKGEEMEEKRLFDLLKRCFGRVKVDYMVEQGAYSSGWNYIKWNSGKIELWIIRDLVFGSNVPNLGNDTHPWYRHIKQIDMSARLKEIISVEAGMQQNGYITQGCVNNATRTMLEIFAMSPIKTVGLKITNVPIRVVGRWK